MDHTARAATPRPIDPKNTSSGDLQRYRRGEITEAEYLEGRIEAATSHLEGRVSADCLKMLKEVIAMRLDTDPLLLEARARLLSADDDSSDDD